MNTIVNSRVTCSNLKSRSSFYSLVTHRSGVSNAERGSMMWLPAEVGPIHRHFKDSSLCFLNLH